MARAVKGCRYADYLALTVRSGGDVERMNPRARKSYLQHRLRLVEAQIQSLSQHLDADTVRLLYDGYCLGVSVDGEQWSSLVSLNYLFAARDVLVRTIATL